MTTNAFNNPPVGYKSIGSFHSEHPDVLMRQDDSEYRVPSLPFDTTITSTSTLSSSASSPLSNDLMMLNRAEWTFLNHGAFGAVLKCAHQRAQEWNTYSCHAQPLEFFDRYLIPHLVYSARRIAKFTSTNAPPANANPNTTTTTNNNHIDGFTLIPNVTSGMNAILQGHVREYPNHKIVLWDISYGSIKKMAHAYYNNRNNTTPTNRVVEIPFQQKYMHMQQQQQQQQIPSVDDEDIFLQALEDTLLQNDGTTADWTQNALFIVDHTTSNTAMTLPIQKLCARAKQAGMITVVDGAHGLLAQDINLSSLSLSGVDMYVSNGHKWLSCPHGIGFLYTANKDIQQTVLRYPAIISHGTDDSTDNNASSTLMSRFMWDGCRDYTAALTVPVVLDVWEQASPTLIRQWMASKLLSAIIIMMETWYPHDKYHNVEDWAGHVTLASIPNIHTTSMALVKLPFHINDHLSHYSNNDNKKTSADAKHVQDFLYHNKIEVPIKCIHGILYVRISCHIYNELEEYDRLAKVLMKYNKY